MKIVGNPTIANVESVDVVDEKTGDIVEYGVRVNFVDGQFTSMHPIGKSGWETAKERDDAAARFVEALKKDKERSLP